MLSIINTIKNSKRVYLYSFSNALLNVILMSILMKTSGGTEYGIFILLSSISGILLDVVSSRTNEAVTFFIRSERHRLGDVLRSGVLLDLLISIIYISCVLIFSLVYTQVEAFETISVSSILFFALHQLVLILFGTSQGLYIAEDKFRVVTLTHALSVLLRVILSIVLIITSMDFDHELITLIFLSSSIVYIPSILKTYFKLNYRVSYKKLLVHGFLSYSMKTFLSSTLKSGNKRVDNLIVGVVFDTQILGLYDFCKKISLPVAYLINPLTSIYFPRFIAAFKKGDEKSVRLCVFNSFLVIGALQILIFSIAILFLMNDPLGLLLDYSKDNVFNFYVVTFIVLSITQHMWWCRALSSSVNPNLSIYGNLILTLLYLFLVYPLSIILDVEGFFMAIILSNFILLVYWLYVLRKVTSVKKNI